MADPIAHRLSFRIVFPSGPSHSNVRISGLVPGTRSTVGGWFARSRQRQALREIAEGNGLLNDIGVSQEEALREADRPFWRR